MKTLLFGFVLMLCGSCIAQTQDLKLPAIVPEVLIPKTTYDYWGKLELSGITKSRSHKNVFWVHNDSGDQPRVFAIDSSGNFYKSDRYQNYEGVIIGGATNVDWEDITTDNKGNIVVADVGNNGNDRKDLVLYIIPEPSPVASNTTWLKKLFFKYPDQKTFADRTDFNYDCEAVFFADNRFHFLSKNRSDSYTKLYRMDTEKTDEVNTLTLLDRFNIQGRVTAADATEDGTKLVVITYEAIWLFERRAKDTSFFKGNIWWLPVKAPQIESVCFKDASTLWLLDEEKSALYEVPLSHLQKVR